MQHEKTKLLSIFAINIALCAYAMGDEMAQTTYDKDQIKNIVARTLFMEARSDYKNSGLQAVASVIWNRAGGETNRLVSVCFEKNQFAVWNGIKPLDNEEYSPSSYVSVIPWQAEQNVIEMRAWVACEKWAGQMVEGTFVSNIGNRNMYDTESSGSKMSWWNRMTDKTAKGEFGQTHIFGYLPERDGFSS